MNPFARCKYPNFTLGFVLLAFPVFFVVKAPAQSTIFSENFEGEWPGTWFVGNDGGVSGYTWGDNNFRAYNGTWSGFCADPGGTVGNSANTYPNSLSTYMEKRSVSLVGYNSPQLTFRYYSALASGDALTVYVRDNLGNWSAPLKTITGFSTGWQLATVDLSAYQGQGGLYVQIRFDSNASGTSSGIWIDDIALTAQAVGALSVTVKDVNGNVFSGAAAVSRYNSSFVFLDSKNTFNGVANWPNVPTGTYNLEAYSNGEFWGAGQATVTQGNTANVTIQRTEPYATSFATKLGSTDVTGGTVPSESSLRHDVTVKNSTAVTQSVRVLLRVDQSQSSPFDFEQTSASQTITSGGTQTFSFYQAPTTSGTYYRYLEVQTLVNNSWVKTDTYDWGLPLTVTEIVRQGVDYSFERPTPKGLQAAGKDFAIRYLGGSKEKNLTGDEAKALHDKGLDLVLVFEGVSDQRMLDGYSAGVSDATIAIQQGAEAWAPQNFFCYFACDWDAGPSDQPAIDSYLDGAADILGRSRVGLYGGYGPVSRALDNGKAAKAWQTDSWSSGLKDSRIKLYQYEHNVSVAGANCDLDEGYGNDLGQWAPLTTAKVIALNGALNFGNVAVGTSRTLALKLANKGNTALNVTSITYPTGFSGNWNFGVVAAGGWVNIIVTFAPQTATAHTGSITVNSDATGGINSIAVAGTGVTSPPPTVSVVPSAGANGSIAPDTAQMVNVSGAASFIATPSSSTYIVDKWLVNNVLAQDGEQNFTITNVTTALSVQVLFKPLPIAQQLTGPTLQENVFRFTLKGDPGGTYILYTSSDLFTWIPFSTNTIPPAGSTNIVDPTAGAQPTRFYRAK